MKILNAGQVRAVDAATIEREPIASDQLMERAATTCVEWISDPARPWITPGETRQAFSIFCGIGNNGGDGLVMARQLAQQGYPVRVYVCRFSEKTTRDFDLNAGRLADIDLPIQDIRSQEEIPEIPSNHIVVDAIFGSGLTRPVEGFTADVIQAMNQSGARIVSIDLPSGLFCDEPLPDKSTVIRAHHTLTFEVPKLSLFMAENFPFTGHWEVLSIGLDQAFIATEKTNYYLLTRVMLHPMMRRRSSHAHKGTFGHALIMAGSHGKMGAAVLAAKACLRSGVGLLTCRIPGCGYEVLQTSVPEGMVICDEEKNHLSQPFRELPYQAIGIGPGIGAHEETGRVLKYLIQESGRPLVIDADGLNLLAENKTWMHFLPQGSILTPHPGEFRRLAGDFDNSFERLQGLRDMAIKHGIFIVLKGHHTAIATPEGQVFFNSTGNPGMATGGSGDVLTGLITGLLAQGYAPREAALLGVYLHGLAGDAAADALSQETMIASDIINHLHLAFRWMN